MPCCKFRNQLIRDWSIARNHHKCFFEVWKRRGLSSGRATTEPPTTTGKLAEDVAGREETTEGPPDELYVEINEGTTSVPEDWEVEPGVLELEDAGDCVEVEVEERGTGVAAMFEFPPLESRREDSNEGSDSARALEIASANALVSGRETG